MWKTIKSHPFKSGLLIILSLPFFVAFIVGGLNYTGMCIMEGRWLSDEEQAQLASQRRGLPDLNYLMNESFKKADEFEKYKPIPYKSIEDFIKHNPNCCRTIGLDNRMSLATDYSALNRIGGLLADIVEVRYTARFDNKGTIIEIPNYTEYPAITNCGRIISRY